MRTQPFEGCAHSRRNADPAPPTSDPLLFGGGFFWGFSKAFCAEPERGCGRGVAALSVTRVRGGVGVGGTRGVATPASPVRFHKAYLIL